MKELNPKTTFIMKAAAKKHQLRESSLKVIKNSTKINKQVQPKIYINTLYPGFSYVNHKGITIVPKKCILH